VLVHPAIDATYGREWKERAISFAINDDSPLVRAQVTLVIRKSTKAQINSDTIPVLESAFKDKAWMVKRQALLWLLQESPTDPASRKLLHKFWLKSYRDEKVATCQLVRVFPNSELPGVILFNEEFSSSEFRDLRLAALNRYWEINQKENSEYPPETILSAMKDEYPEIRRQIVELILSKKSILADPINSELIQFLYIAVQWDPSATVRKMGEHLAAQIPSLRLIKTDLPRFFKLKTKFFRSHPLQSRVPECAASIESMVKILLEE
jgi:hypothetical protein